MVGHGPLAPLSGSVDDAVRGFGRCVAGWPTSDHRRPGGSRQVAVGLPPALPPSTVGSGAPANGCAPSPTPPLSSRRGQRRPTGHRVDPSSSAGRGRSMGLWRGYPPGQASSRWPADLHPSSLGDELDEDQRATWLAPQLALAWPVA